VSKTDLEEDLRSTFERAATSVPLAPDLVSRASSGARRQQRRTLAASGVAAAAVAVLAVVGFSLQSGGPAVTPHPAASRPTQPIPTTGTTTAPTMQGLSGSWRPVKLDGFVSLKAARPEDPILIFSPDGTWSGSDGCNSISGTFTVGQRGEFTSTANGQRLVGCDNVPNTAVLAAAKRISSDRNTLRFFAGDGRQVATYARTR
jgi:heat shock protein HslJ